MKEKNIAEYLTLPVLDGIIALMAETSATERELLLIKNKIANHIEAIDEWFEHEFWPAYNYKVGRGAALKAARQLSAKMRAEVMESLPNYERYLRNTGISKKHASTYLNKSNQHWKDFLPTDKDRRHLAIAQGLIEFWRHSWKNPQYLASQPTVQRLFELSVALEDNFGEVRSEDIAMVAKWVIESWQSNPDLAGVIRPEAVLNVRKWPNYLRLASAFHNQKNQVKNGTVHV